LSSISSTNSSTENDLPHSRQYKLTPLQAMRSFIFPPHFLHFMSFSIYERGLNENTRHHLLEFDVFYSFMQCYFILLFWLVQNLLNPSLEKRGKGRFYGK